MFYEWLSDMTDGLLGVPNHRGYERKGIQALTSDSRIIACLFAFLLPRPLPALIYLTIPITPLTNPTRHAPAINFNAAKLCVPFITIYGGDLPSEILPWPSRIFVLGEVHF